MNKRGNRVAGTILVVLGVLYLLKNLDILNIHFNVFDIFRLLGVFWPAVFLMLPGFIFHYAFFAGNNRDPGLLVPGGILLTIGITCQVSTLFGLWHVMWPGFILAVAVGLFELYLFGSRDKGLLIPVIILGGISIIFFFTFSLRWFFDLRLRQLLTGGVIILVGLSLLLKGGNRQH